MYGTIKIFDISTYLDLYVDSYILPYEVLCGILFLFMNYDGSQRKIH